jgi:hypothetical protein
MAYMKSIKAIPVLGAFLIPAMYPQEPAAGLREHFRNPPAKFRPLVITHSRALENPGMLDWLSERRAGGMAVDAGVTPRSRDFGGEKWNNPTYLNDPSMLERFRKLVAEMRARDMTVWIYDELGYPSGSAGGRVLDGHPGYQVWVVGSRTFTPSQDGTVRVEVTHPNVEACYALPKRGGVLLLEEARDLTARARRGGFVWKAPSAEWVVCLLERYQPDTWRRHNIPRRNVNILDRGAIRRFIDLTHDRYAKTLGDQLREVELFFTDEPQLSATEHWGSGAPEAPPAVQWCDELPPAFRRKHGYDLGRVLPALFHPVGPKTVKYRHDFYDVQSDLVAENYFGQLQDWCRRHGVLSSGHMLLEESLLFHVMFSGSYWKNMARMDIPGVDLIGRTLPRYKTMGGWGIDSIEDFSSKLASSVAHLLQKPGVFTESFALANKATLREVLGVTAWQFSGGITHMSTYTIQEHFSAADYGSFADFAGRLALFGRRGAPAADVAVLVPERSVWAVYNPPDGGLFRRYLDRNPEALRIDEIFRLTSHVLLRNQRDFEHFSEDVLQRAAVEKSGLAVGSERFPFLVLPEMRMIERRTLDKIRVFLGAGGNVVVAGSLPHQTPGAGEDPGITRDVKALLAAHPQQVKHIETAGELDEVVGWMKQRVPPFVSWDGPSQVRLLHRREPEREILLVANPSRQAAEGTIRVAAAGSAWLWDPETGQAHPIGERMAGDPVQVAVPAESARIVTLEHGPAKDSLK